MATNGIFGVKLLRQTPTVEEKARFPRLIAVQGDSPEQYPYSEDMEEDLDEDDEGEESLVIVITEDELPLPQSPKSPK